MCGFPTFENSLHTPATCKKGHSPTPHPERNTETTPFQLSTHGSKWIVNKNGPFVHSKFLLNGSSRFPPNSKTGTIGKCTYSLITSSVLTQHNNNSDYLPMLISINQVVSQLPLKIPRNPNHKEKDQGLKIPEILV